MSVRAGRVDSAAQACRRATHWHELGNVYAEPIMRRPSRPSIVVALAVSALGALGSAAGMGCRSPSRADAARRQSDEATAEAEEKAQEATLTSATMEVKDEARQSADDALRAKGEMIAAFRLEQSDYRGRIQRALDGLDKEIGRVRLASARRGGALRDLQARRDLLKSDLDLVERSTEPDWATARIKLDRDLRGTK